MRKLLVMFILFVLVIDTANLVSASTVLYVLVDAPVYSEPSFESDVVGWLNAGTRLNIVGTVYGSEYPIAVPYNMGWAGFQNQWFELAEGGYISLLPTSSLGVNREGSGSTDFSLPPADAGIWPVLGRLIATSCWPVEVHVLDLWSGRFWQVGDETFQNFCGMSGSTFWKGYAEDGRTPQWFMPVDTIIHYMVIGKNNAMEFMVMIGESPEAPNEWFVLPFTRNLYDDLLFSQMQEIHPDGAVMLQKDDVAWILGM